MWILKMLEGVIHKLCGHGRGIGGGGGGLSNVHVTT